MQFIKLLKSFRLTTLLITLISAVPGSTQESNNQEGPIIVTAHSLGDSQKRLEDCLARQCPPNEDVDATLAHAENLFIAGDYSDARNIIRKSVHRNRNQAKNYPVDISDLYRASAVIDQHLGEVTGFLHSTISSRDALKAGLPANDARIFLAQLAIGDMRAQLGYYDEAERYYRQVWQQAQKLSLHGVVARARLRDAHLSSVRADPRSVYASQFRTEARRKFRSIVTDYEANQSAMALVARIALARLDMNEGNSDAVTAIIARYGKIGKNAQRPVLLFAPSINDTRNETDRARAAGSGSTTMQMATSSFDNVWADVGFWVRPDGTTSDIEILRQHGSSSWLRPVMLAIKSRRYSATDTDPADPGFFIMERYSLASPKTAGTGSRIRTKSAYGKIERLDLTVEPPTNVEPK